MLKRLAATFLALAWALPVVAQVPKITSISPESGPPGTSIGISGTGFVAKSLAADEKSALGVLIDDAPGEVANVSETGLVSRIGSDLLVGRYKFQVVLSAFKEVDKQRVDRILGKSNIVTFDVVPQIVKLEPDRAVDGTKVLLRGGPFKSKVGTVKALVYFDGKSVPTTDVDENTLQFTVPKLKLGNYSVTVQIGSAKTAAASTAKTFSIIEPPKKYPPPSIDEIAPGDFKPGDPATLKGKNIRAGCIVLVDGTATNTNFNAASNDLSFGFDLTIAPGPHKVQVEAKDQGVVQTSQPKMVTIKPFDAVLDSIDPLETTPGGPVTLFGKQIGPGVTVYFNEAPAEKQGSPSMTKIGFTVPVTCAPGSYNIWLQVGTKRSKTFRIKVGDLNPTIKELSPDKGKPGEWISISGDQFGYTPTPGLTVEVNGKPTAVEWYGNRGLRFAITQGTPAGIYNVAVRVGTKTSNTLTLTVERVPASVRNVTPNPVVAGTVLQIEGGGYLEGTTVLLGGRAIPITDFKPDRLLVTIPLDMPVAKHLLVINVPTVGTAEFKGVEVVAPPPAGDTPPPPK